LVGVFVGVVGSSCVETICSYVSIADCRGVDRISLEVSIKGSFSSSTFDSSAACTTVSTIP
jgi:hypothetical protein